MSDRAVQWIATWCYVGRFPVFPGTMASAVGLLMAWGLSSNPVFFAAVTFVVAVAGFMVSGKMEQLLHQKDPSSVVIDEVAGIMVALFLLPWKWPVIWTAFVLFRLLDMTKLFPLDRLEQMPGARGIMLDDLYAGLYTNIIMQLAIRLAGI